MTDEKKALVRRHGITISIATLLAWLPLAPAFWVYVKPVLVQAVSEALADDIQRQVQAEVRPLNTAFRTILKKQIDRLRVDIRVMESQRDRDRESWTDVDARRLEDKQIELEDLRAAYWPLVNPKVNPHEGSR